MKSTIQTIVICLVIAVSVLYLGGKFPSTPSPVQGAVAAQPVTFTANNATSSVGTIPTTIFASNSYHLFARISNTSANAISCNLETVTPASSTLSVGKGITINASTTAIVGGGSACFGYPSSCNPYIGQINCIAPATSTVGVSSY